MKKMIKKLISVIAIICLMATSVVVFAEDTAIVSESKTVNFTDNMYTFGTNGITANSTFLSLKRNTMVIYVLPIPETQPGKKIDSYTFTHYTGAGSVCQYIKVPQYDITSEEFLGLTLSSEGIAEKLDKQITKTANKTYNAMDSVTTVDLGKVIYDQYNAYQNTVDLTTYMNECIDAGAEDYILLGANHYNTTAYMYSPSSAKAIEAGYNTSYTYTEADADPMTLAESSPANGATGVSASAEVYFTFSNSVKEATVLVNGAAAATTISGSKVTVNATFGQYSDYTVEINATDKYNQTISQTVSFTTGAKTVVNEDKSQITAVHVTASAPVSVARGGSDVDLRNNKFILYKVKLPRIESGLIDNYKITYAENSSSESAKSSFFKLPGEAWDTTTITVNDEAVNTIITSLKTNGWKSEYYAQDSDSVYDTSKTLATMPLCTGDVTSYVRECLAKNQTYMYLGITSLGSTQSAHGTNSYYYNPTITYEIIDPEFKTVEEVKIVAADNADGYDAEGLTVLSKGASYKAITSITNKTSENMTVVIAIADYNDDTLEGVSLKTVEVKSGAFEKLIETDAITVSSDSTKAKAFMWKALGNEPYGENLEVMVQ